MIKSGSGNFRGPRPGFILLRTRGTVLIIRSNTTGGGGVWFDGAFCIGTLPSFLAVRGRSPVGKWQAFYRSASLVTWAADDGVPTVD